MRVEVTLLDPRTRQTRHVLIDAADSVPTGDVLDSLIGRSTAAVAEDNVVVSLDTRRAQSLSSSGRPPFYLRGKELEPQTPCGESGIRQGSLIVLGSREASMLTEPDGVAELRIVGGPGAGTVHRVSVGDSTIGSDHACTVVLDDDRVPPISAIITVDVTGAATLRATDGSVDVLTETFADVEHPLALDRVPLTTNGSPWVTGAELTVGHSLIELCAVTFPDAALTDSPETGWVDYNRPPRLLPADRETKFKLPAKPSESHRSGLPFIAMMLPVFMGVAAAFIFNNPRMLMMAFFSPVMMLGSWIQSRKEGKKSSRKQKAEYEEKLAATEQDAADALVAERIARRLEAPDPAAALLIASGPRARLWERRTTDPDYLSIRLGVGDLPSEVTVEDPQQLEHRRKTYRTAYDVPIVVSLRERGVLGITGRGNLPRQVARWAVAQLAVLQSPGDTQFYVLSLEENPQEWEWLRWLPHCRPQNGQDTVITFGTDAETCARRIAELTSLLAARQSAVRATSGTNGQLHFGSDIVVVLEGARRLRSLPGVVSLLKQGPAVGIHLIALDSDERLLPEEADAVVIADGEFLALRQQQATLVDTVRPDLVDDTWLWAVARSLAPIHDISGNEDDSVLPAGCRLTEVLGIEPPTSDLIRAHWSLSGRSTEAVVGVSLDGPFAIDMRKDGPHGLVAGTTGSGKSELLQTIVASLAVANRPDAMTFVLVDYKGGAAFKDCVDLPHTVGMVTDLDTHLVERALISLGAELTRREHQLATVGAKDIEDYTDIMDKRTGIEPMPRLLIVIDEFASLARELPDFVTGLVNIAQRGRSLGIHLILATQRPGGVVSPEIRANTNLRIALRVTDTSESVDVLDAPDAAKIAKSTPGRAYVRLGASSLVPFQSGRVGGRRPGVVTKTTDLPWVKELRLCDLPAPVPTRPKTEAVDDAEITDLSVLVGAIREANDSLGFAPQHSPWLPSLTTSVHIEELKAPTPKGSVPTIPYGVEDLPAEQERRVAAIDFASFTHLSVVGGPRSGRSQILRTIAGGMAENTSPVDVHLFGLDCGNGALLPMAELPHCGAIVQRIQTERVVRLFDRLAAELAHRQAALAEGGYADCEEWRSAKPEDERPPHIVFMIDRWEGFLGSLAELDNGRLTEIVYTLLREGASVGIHLVITGDRQLVSTRMGSLIEDKLCLRLPERGDYSLVGLVPRKMPEDIPEGRAFRGDSGIEMQIALLDEDAGGQAQGAALRRIAAAARVNYTDIPKARRPFRVDVLPSNLTFEQAWGMRELESTSDKWGLIGVGGDELTAIGLDLSRTPSAMIGGPNRSGRSTILAAIGESLLRGGNEIVIIAPRPSPLRDFDGKSGVRAVLTESEPTEETLRELLDAPATPVTLLIDDAELLKDSHKEWFRSYCRTMIDRHNAIVLAGNPDDMASGFSGWQVDLKGNQGVLIAPQSSTDGELIGIRIPRSSIGQRPTTGRVLAHIGDGELRTVQVPTLD